MPCTLVQVTVSCMGIRSVLLTLLQWFSWMLIAQALLSWLPSSGVVAKAKWALSRVTNVVLRPLRRVLPVPRFGGMPFDLSVLVALFAVRALTVVVANSSI